MELETAGMRERERKLLIHKWLTCLNEIAVWIIN